MEDKIPNITDADIERIVRRDFSQVAFADVIGTLKKYESETEQGRNRVWASILKLAGGDIELLRLYVEKACYDYRDVIAAAEYPKYTPHAFGDLLDGKAAPLMDKDWKQYQSWLNKP
ncbi:hypothetical protein [Polluticoccus soli]|uniref:hypothetical protein n=1 Tax=Polluticoccus soli TaxID=3034150 RepID=UPI0023E16084|nr:hypothetical protein [Flavipsychrobacter sp. JY13-12]